MKKMKRQFAIVMIATILLSVLTVIPVMSQSKDEKQQEYARCFTSPRKRSS
jgi:hypothetical protein